ncbi:hypothetical protein COO59_19540 [Mixta theicola]|uniref:Uncharacterized protein n=1 Tax=Mixta theicola TaxID=1458355 RepID=A0A2K1Q4S9_9GAMM|nr:hypothetical protein [Mixta theicola]PNS10052.1 hypothetical protein COO59_19540 [Mixta theicola]GLR09022.1 hypothetical protein GCM10007905_17420 [Mixta theicola]
MANRNSVIDGQCAPVSDNGLVYSEILGWIDLGHARGMDILQLLYKMDIGEHGQSDYYTVSYGQTMYKDSTRRIGIGKHCTWRIKRGRSLPQRHSIALAMMMSTAMRFEALQASIPFSWRTDSGFSAEDLVSDLFGFYRAIRPNNYFPFLLLISKAEALARWDHYGPPGNYKNKLFKPLLFPDPQKNRHAVPQYGQLPNFMMSVEPFTNFASGIAEIVTDNGTQINVFTQPRTFDVKRTP